MVTAIVFFAVFFVKADEVKLNFKTSDLVTEQEDIYQNVTLAKSGSELEKEGFSLYQSRVTIYYARDDKYYGVGDVYRKNVCGEPEYRIVINGCYDYVISSKWVFWKGSDKMYFNL